MNEKDGSLLTDANGKGGRWKTYVKELVISVSFIAVLSNIIIKEYIPYKFVLMPRKCMR